MSVLLEAPAAVARRLAACRTGRRRWETGVPESDPGRDPCSYSTPSARPGRSPSRAAGRRAPEKTPSVAAVYTKDRPRRPLPRGGEGGGAVGREALYRLIGLAAMFRPPWARF